MEILIIAILSIWLILSFRSLRRHKGKLAADAAAAAPTARPVGSIPGVNKTASFTIWVYLNTNLFVPKKRPHQGAAFLYAVF